MQKKSLFSLSFFKLWGWLTLLVAAYCEFMWIPIVLYNNDYDWKRLLNDLPIDLFVCALVALFNCAAWHAVRTKLPVKQWSGRKMALATAAIIAGNFLIGFLLLTGEKWLYEHFTLLGDWKFAKHFFHAYLLTTLTSLIVITNLLLWLADTLRRKHEGIMEAKIKLLKNQINPHFLFNNLSTGISLIRYDPDQAVKFFSAMSEVYRHVLEYSMTTLQPLHRELQDLEQYLTLLRIRFGEASIKTDIRLTPGQQELQILSGTLQLLFENIVKHNVFSQGHPMDILLEIKGRHLFVSNDYRPIPATTPSHGIGQQTLAQRYKHFGKEKITFYRQDNKYIVKLPLFPAKP